MLTDVDTENSESKPKSIRNIYSTVSVSVKAQIIWGYLFTVNEILKNLNHRKVRKYTEVVII